MGLERPDDGFQAPELSGRKRQHVGAANPRFVFRAAAHLVFAGAVCSPEAIDRNRSRQVDDDVGRHMKRCVGIARQAHDRDAPMLQTPKPPRDDGPVTHETLTNQGKLAMLTCAP